MAFLRAEKKTSGTYLRIIQSYKLDGKSKHRTLYSLGKLEDHDVDQLARIAKKLLELVDKNIVPSLVLSALHFAIKRLIPKRRDQSEISITGPFPQVWSMTFLSIGSSRSDNLPLSLNGHSRFLN